MGNQDIELQADPPVDGDKRVSLKEDTPPAPPKRDYLPQEPPQPEAKKKRFASFPRPEVIYKPESNKTFMTCLKNLFILFNLLIWLFGAVLTGIGIWTKVDEDFWNLQSGLEMKQFSTAGYILIATGVFIMLVGFLGCYGALAENVCMLITFLIVVLIIIMLEIAVAAIVWTASNNKDLKEDIKGKVRTAIQKMADEENKRYFLELLQTKLKCCGIDGPDEYETFGDMIPRSCRNGYGYPHAQGCLDASIAYLKGKSSILGGIAIAVFVLQLAAIIITCTIVSGLRHAANIII